MATMKAVRLHTFGSPDVMIYEDAPRPTASAGEVLVRVHAAGVNPADWWSRGSGKDLLAPIHIPLILGWDVSGVVEAIGDGVTRFKTGDAVFGMVRFPDWGETYAEYTAVPADHLALKPEKLTHIEAAGVPLVTLTAWQALFEVGNLQAGQRVLIHAAAGGVGHVAVQLAKWKGAYVIGTASTRNVEYLKNLGVDQVVDYTTTAFDETLHDLDLVLNTLDSTIANKSFNTLKRGGAMVSISALPSAELAAQYGVQVENILVHTDTAQLEQIAGLCQAGVLKPTIDHVFPLADAPEAHRQGETKRTRGKLILAAL